MSPPPSSLPSAVLIISILPLKNTTTKKIPSSRTRHRRSPRLHELAYFTTSLHDKLISLTRCHDFSPAAPPSLPRARLLDRLTNAVNSPNNPLRLPTPGHPKVRKVIPPGSPSALPHRIQAPPFTHSMADTRPGLPPLNPSASVASPLHVLSVSSAFRMPSSLVGTIAISQNRRGSVTHCAPASGPAR